MFLSLEEFELRLFLTELSSVLLDVVDRQRLLCRVIHATVNLGFVAA